MTITRQWFDAESSGAPPALRVRAAEYLEGHSTMGDPAAELALAATAALEATLARPGGRAVALDLLAADALVTLALKARAATDPAGLLKFAAELRDSGARIR